MKQTRDGKACETKSASLTYSRNGQFCVFTTRACRNTFAIESFTANSSGDWHETSQLARDQQPVERCPPLNHKLNFVALESLKQSRDKRTSNAPNNTNLRSFQDEATRAFKRGIQYGRFRAHPYTFWQAFPHTPNWKPYHAYWHSNVTQNLL